MLYCKLGDKSATVTWKWENQPTKKFISKVVPIDVTVDPVSESSGNTMGTWTMDTYDNITASSPFSYAGDASDSPVFSGRKILSAKDGRELYSDGSTYAGDIRARNIKFTPDSINSINGYKITISNSTGGKLFEEKKFNVPAPTYEVACGENCPPGHVRCESLSYPGYCCMPCSTLR